MPKNGQSVPETEPIGIIISRGRTVEVSPRVSAFMWGLAEEPEDEKLKVKAK